MNDPNVNVLATQVFAWSTPAPNIGGDIPRRWRVAHADVLRDILGRIGYDERVAYVEYLNDNPRYKAVWVGLRDNRNAAQHTANLLVLADKLKALGLQVEPAMDIDTGFVLGLNVLDTIDRRERS
jgi:hypothetical protein